MIRYEEIENGTLKFWFFRIKFLNANVGIDGNFIWIFLETLINMAIFSRLQYTQKTHLHTLELQFNEMILLLSVLIVFECYNYLIIF